VLVALSLLFSLFVAEAAMRVRSPQWSDQWKMYRLDPIYVRGLQPNVKNALVHGHSREFAFRFSTNAQGLRMEEDLQNPKPTGIFRILIVGDSFTFGYGVEQGQSYPRQLQRYLDPKGDRLEVINAGFASGYTLTTEYLFTREMAEEWQPDLVLVGVCLSNDLGDLALTSWRIAEGDLASARKNNDWVPIWVKKSGLVNLVVKDTIPRIRSWLAGSPSEDARIKAERKPACEFPTPAPGTRPAAKPPSSPPPVLREDALAWSAKEQVAWLLHAWSRHAARSGYELVLLLVPGAHEIRWETSLGELAVHAQTRATFADAAAKVGVRVLDPVVAMRTHSCESGEKLYFGQDGHWNPRGHAFIGEWLASELRADRH
jgi:hypothetical protein